MHFVASPYIITGLAIAAAFAVLFLYTLRYRNVSQEATPLALTLLLVSIWLAAYSLGLTSVDVETKLIWSKIEYIGITLMPLSLVTFAFFYSRNEKWSSPKRLALLAIIPLVTLILAWTNESHELIWRNIRIVDDNSITLMDKTYGPWFWIQGTYIYLLLLTSSILTVKTAFASSHKKLAVAVTAGVLAPWICNVLYLFHVAPMPYLDLTPYAFAFTCVMLVLMLFRYKLLDILPIARSSIIDHMNDGLIILDAQDVIVDLNPVAQKVLGLSKLQAITKPLSQTTLSHTEQALTEIVIEANGKKQYFDIVNTPLSDSKGIFCGKVLLLRDITAHRKMESQLKLSEQWYRGLFNASPEAIMLIGAKAKIREVSDRFYEMTEYKPEHILGKSVLELPFLSANSSKIVAEKVSARLQGQEIYPYEIDFVTASGQLRTVRLFGTLMDDIDGQTTYDLVIVSDITAEQKSQQHLMRSEEKLKDYSKNLEAMVAERTQKLKEAQEQLFEADKLASIGQLASGVAHQLRNPLGVINNAAHFIQLKFGPTDVKLENYADLIKEEVIKATSIINGILDFARIRQPDAKMANINTLLTKALKSVNIHKNIETVKELDDTLPEISVDTVQINQAAVSIIANAIQSMPKGGTLSILSRKVNGFIEVEIKDTGVGISQEHLDKIFEPLFTTKAKKGGTGIGLTLARSIVSAHNGSIEVASVVDEGTSFVIKLPISSNGNS